MNSLLSNDEYENYHIMGNSQVFKLTSDRNNISNINDLKVQWVLDQIKDIIDNQIDSIAQREYFSMMRIEEEYEVLKKCERTISNINKISRLEDLAIDMLPIKKRPRNEFEAALLFVSILANKYTEHYINEDITQILSYSAKLPTDMICVNSEGNMSLVEVDFKLGNLFKHKHPIETVDYIVCRKIDIDENRVYKINGESCVLINDKEKKCLVFDKKVIRIIELISIIDSIKTDIESIKL